MTHAKNIDPDNGGQRSERGLDRRIAELASRQHGVIERMQLIELGLSSKQIDRRIKLGRLQPLYRGVYAVGHRALTNEGRWMAAVLAGGRGAVLSHRSAANLWRIRQGFEARMEVTVPRKRRSRRGLTFHVCALPADEVTVRDGIPVTTVPRTLFDLAATADLRQLERMVNEAEVQRLWDELGLDDLLHRYSMRPGSRTVRAVLRERRAGATLTRSELEVLFLRFADRAGLPRPETNVPIEGFDVDCVWRRERVVVEIDSWSFHSTRGAFERDRRKSRALQAAGWRCVPVTYLQLRHHSEEVARDVRRMLSTATLAA
jgi:very-short-patch-repair endonuclease